MQQVQSGDIFSDSYQRAREKFLQAAAAMGLAVESDVLPEQGAAGETLAVDSALDGDPRATNLLVVLSGVHGVEGYCGSAIQTGILRARLAGQSLPSDVAVLYVHAINPYGFSHSRRVTQENVDLNRNFIDFGAPVPVNAGYEAIHDLLLPPTWPPGPEVQRKLEEYRTQHGARGFQRAVSLGQYVHADGMFFGGFGPTWSNAAFRRILRRHVGGRRHLASIDLHTGLGPFGVGERIFACPHDPVVLERARRWWGNVTSVDVGTSTSIPLTGPIQTAFHEEAPDAAHTHVCLEYGTYEVGRMLEAVRAEHWAYRSAASESARLGEARRALKDFFYPATDEWKSAVWQQGFEVYTQTLAGLAEGLPAPA